ncbi:Rhodanese-like domain-containing protein [Naematelia encephala]|uniref:Rhodanese-like domain-containing protein n=1 Tax=Naematelia encephala TaxID=71784 RepID=A0A1Y2ASX1_9TREE|nr:Rhodanese-like domain-containing protein [Naematelia encephala]
MRFPPITIARLRAQPLLVQKTSMSVMSVRMKSSVPLLITPEEYKKLPKATTVPLDVSWHMPNSPRSALAEYLSGPRLPHARRWNLDEVAELDVDKNPLSLTHMLPSKEKFREACEKHGISDDSHVVCYDTVGVFSSPRAVYTFKALGHDKVSALDGGLPRWIAEGGETEIGESADFGEGEYKGKEPLDGVVRSYEQVVSNSEKPLDDGNAEIVLDLRSRARYDGTAPEPRPGLSSGHIPNSLPAPFSDYLEPPSDTKPYSHYKSLPELKTVLVDAVGGEERWHEIEQGHRGVVFSCGSGMTAAIGWLAEELIKDAEGWKGPSAIYDESWTGYASRQESKIVKGDKVVKGGVNPNSS